VLLGNITCMIIKLRTVFVSASEHDSSTSSVRIVAGTARQFDSTYV